MGLQDAGFASNSAGVTVAGGLLLVGQQVSDNQRRDAPSGMLRAYDAAARELRWAWDALRPDAQAPLAEGEIYPRGTPNVCNVIAADEELGLAVLGTGSPGADHWGGNRTAREDQTTAAVVAVDLATGQERWTYATVIHDLWDYDIGAQPLVDVAIDGTMWRAVMQGTKTGNLFLLDAATGAPLRPVEQKPVPQGALPGEYLSPTQPQSVFYPNFSGLPDPDPELIDPRHTWGITPIDAAMCRLKFHQTRYDGMFTPPADPGTPMLLVPGTAGGLNRGWLGFDPISGSSSPTIRACRIRSRWLSVRMERTPPSAMAARAPIRRSHRRRAPLTASTARCGCRRLGCLASRRPGGSCRPRISTPAT